LNPGHAAGHAPPSEQESLQVAEASREAEWRRPSFLRELFLGRFRLDLIHPFPEAPARPEFAAFYDKLKMFLEENVNPAAIDKSGEYPPKVVEGLKKLGAFGMKIPREYGGLGFTQTEYDTAMKLLGATDGNVTALLSAHQSIGVPQPIKIFGTPEQKKNFLPRCAAGAISAFALTEPEVGSDPSALKTTAELTPEKDAYILNGEKLWTTNGTFAELLVVMAVHPGTRKISAFIVESSTPGVQVVGRCRFMGLKAIGNAVIRLTNVRVPVENRVGAEGQGLKIALVTLNTGRLALPAAAVGVAKRCLEICRAWSGKRVQWGRAIGKHEAISHKIASMAATTFAMEAVSDLASRLSDLGGTDIRLEAAAAKEWNTCRGWDLVDETMQIRGGRGYETEQSLADRGEEPIDVERMMRDFRINRIFEGSSEIMHLFIAREAVDRHLQVAGAMVDPKKGAMEKLSALPKIAGFYALWYPARWLGWGHWPRFHEFGRLATHLQFADRAARKLAREMFHGMMIHRAKMPHRQAFLFRLVDVGLELFVIAAVVSRARTMLLAGHPEAQRAVVLADLAARLSRRKIKTLFRGLWNNDDKAANDIARRTLAGEYSWLETHKTL
jgi:alkylation response protein AidB-like acyl-CoA dehydrogenase